MGRSGGDELDPGKKRELRLPFRTDDQRQHMKMQRSKARCHTEVFKPLKILRVNLKTARRLRSLGCFPALSFILCPLMRGNRFWAMRSFRKVGSHACGLSQNGARKMAEKGKNFLEIRKYYYGEIELRILLDTGGQSFIKRISKVRWMPMLPSQHFILSWVLFLYHAAYDAASVYGSDKNDGWSSDADLPVSSRDLWRMWFLRSM